MCKPGRSLSEWKWWNTSLRAHVHPGRIAACNVLFAHMLLMWGLSHALFLYGGTLANIKSHVWLVKESRLHHYVIGRCVVVCVCVGACVYVYLLSVWGLCVCVCVCISVSMNGIDPYGLRTCTEHMVYPQLLEATQLWAPTWRYWHNIIVSKTGTAERMHTWWDVREDRMRLDEDED